MGYVLIKSARIEGEVILDGARITHEVILADCELRGQLSGRNTVWDRPLLLLGGLCGEVDLGGANLLGGLRLDRTKVMGGFRLHSATCEGLLSVSDCEFLDARAGVDCESMIITGDALLTDVRMSGPVSFNRSQVTGTLDLTRGTFLYRSSPAVFSTVRIGGDCVLGETTFANGALYDRAGIGGDLKAADCWFGSGSGETSFRMVSIGRDVVFQRVKFDGRLDLGGMEYNGLRVDGGPKMWGGAFALIARAVYDRDVYERLEKHLRRLGYTREADRVFVESMRRQRKERLPWLARVLDYVFLDLLLGYGRSRLPVLVVGAAMVGCGAWVFRGKNMVQKVPNHRVLKYSALWFSLDLFIPLINLRMKDDWVLSDRCRFRRYWMPVLVVYGWFVAIVVVAAITSYIIR
ncbi:MAG: hypothetical protein MUP47_11375 [Phycisphaerae bacterium]|nr:hypothetical protein [Phycisphaerae bacterium]